MSSGGKAKEARDEGQGGVTRPSPEVFFTLSIIKPNGFLSLCVSLNLPNPTPPPSRTNSGKLRSHPGSVALSLSAACGPFVASTILFLSRDAGAPSKQDEAERKLQELKQRRNDAESEELEKMKLKQQDAEAELEGLKRKREERRKVMEEEERKRKQEQEEKKAREQVEARSLQSSRSLLSIISRLCWCVRLPQEERRKMKEEIEKRRAEAAEKKKQQEEEVGTGKPAFSISTKGSSKVRRTTVH